MWLMITPDFVAPKGFKHKLSFLPEADRVVSAEGGQLQLVYSRLSQRSYDH